LAIGSINRSMEEERRVQVLVRDNNVDQALKVLKKKMQREGIFREMKLRGHYEKPSERRVREKAEAIRRARKLARKKLQREGLLPMKPRVIPGVPGRGGPARTLASDLGTTVTGSLDKFLAQKSSSTAPSG
jgi:small subunit ribosomal protein S21